MKQHYQYISAVISNKAFQTSEAFVSILDKNAVLVSLNQISKNKMPFQHSKATIYQTSKPYI